MTTYKVLVVEDDQTLANCLMDGMESQSNGVRFVGDIVHSVADCEAKLAATGYDVILLDLNLRNGKGESTFTRIYAAANKNMGAPDEIRMPIVIMTGSTNEYSSLIIKGAMDVIFKPVTISDLCQRLWMAILNFPYRKTKELHEVIDDTIAEAKRALRPKE